MPKRTFTRSSDNYPLVEVPGRDGVWHIAVRSPGHSGDGWCHLIPGKDRAVLLDTGFGIGRLRDLVESLTDLPVTVVNSHNHGDHILGNSWWDEVYIHEYEAQGLYDQMETDGIGELPPPEERPFVFYENEIVPQKKYKVNTIQGGHVFDLGGGYDLEVIHVPGHAPGGIVLLDRKRRMLFSGDAILRSHVMISGPRPGLGPYHTVEMYKEGLLRVMEHFDEFDVVYGGHNRLGVSKQIVPDFIACCDELLSGDLTVHDVATVNCCAGFGRTYHRHGMGRIAFSPERIHIADLPK